MLLDLTDECIAAAQGELPDAQDGARRTSITVFRNPIIERWFARAHFITPLFWFGPVIAIGIARSFSYRLGAARMAQLFILGIVVWTLTEYLLHRFLFHAEFPGKAGAIRHFLLHGYHHVFPNDPMRLVAPPIMSWGPALVFAGAYFLVFGAAQFATVLAGTVSGYLAYDWIHYYTHHGRPRWALGKFLRKYHMLHHFRSPHSFYGVSSPLWDQILRTGRARP